MLLSPRQVMSVPRAFIVSVFAFSALFAACTAGDHVSTIDGKIDGNINLYTSTNFKNLLLSVNVRFPNQCYNVDCSFLDNKIASAKWTGLPKTGINDKTYMVFHQDSNCEGNATTIKYPHNGGISAFPVKVKSDISSFMVKSPNKDIDNGSAYICAWMGARVVGGSVSQDDTLHMVNATV